MASYKILERKRVQAIAKAANDLDKENILHHDTALCEISKRSDYSIRAVQETINKYSITGLVMMYRYDMEQSTINEPTANVEPLQVTPQTEPKAKPKAKDDPFIYSSDEQPYWVQCTKCMEICNIGKRKNYHDLNKDNIFSLCPNCDDTDYYDMIKREFIVIDEKQKSKKWKKNI